MYKYLLIDLDDTLLDFKKAEAKAVWVVLKSFGIKPTKKTVETYSKINKACWKRFEKGEISKEEIYIDRVNMLAQRLGVEIEPSEFTKRYLVELSKQGQNSRFAKRFLKSLLKKGYIIAAVTNGTLATQTGRIARSGLEKYFVGGIFISEQIGLKKPDKEFFDFVLNALEVKNKAEVLVIGDSITSDIKGALNSELDSCLVGGFTAEEPDIVPTYHCKNLMQIISVCGLRRNIQN